jgi:NAD(P)-dependent dehydrogenase (short-subunit alcohol dehydrogenase family)
MQICPGLTLTTGIEATIAQRADVEESIVRGTTLGRLVEPDEVAAVVLFPASPAAEAVTGINLPVDCGWLARGLVAAVWWFAGREYR